MAYRLAPRSFWNSTLWDSPMDWDNDWMSSSFDSNDGFSLYEGDNNMYVEAAMPGIDMDDIDVSYDRGTVWIRGETKQMDEDDKKYYRRANRSFSYRVTLPGEIDQAQQPSATYDNGVLLVTLPKKAEAEPQQIPVSQGLERAGRSVKKALKKAKKTGNKRIAKPIKRAARNVREKVEDTADRVIA